jgi:hypothetical protein
MCDVQHKMFVHDDGSAVAAKSIFRRTHGAVIGAGKANWPLTILLQPVMAGIAGAAAINHAAHAHQVAGFETGDLRAGGRHPSHDFVARDARIFCARPFAADRVQIAVAHPAEQDVHGDVFGAWCAALDGHRR